MLFVWRGAGIIVPIIFFITAWIVSYWYDDTRLGNADFMGWSSMYAGIVLLLIGLGIWGGSKSENENENEGQVIEVKRKHDFFFIPIAIWGLILGGLSIYLLFFVDNKVNATESVTNIQEQIIFEPTTRIVNFYNPTDDTITYFIADETQEGLIEKDKVAPQSVKKIELEERTYMLFANNSKKERTLSLPSEEDAENKSKYVLYKDSVGRFYQRIINAQTAETDDYDEAWLVLDDKYIMVLVDVTYACNDTIKKEDIENTNWQKKIYTVYKATDLIEPFYKKQLNKEKVIHVFGPTDKLPLKVNDNDIVYMLIPYSGSGEKNKVIQEKIIEACF